MSVLEWRVKNLKIRKFDGGCLQYENEPNGQATGGGARKNVESYRQNEAIYLLSLSRCEVDIINWVAAMVFGSNLGWFTAPPLGMEVRQSMFMPLTLFN